LAIGACLIGTAAVDAASAVRLGTVFDRLIDTINVGFSGGLYVDGTEVFGAAKAVVAKVIVRFHGATAQVGVTGVYKAVDVICWVTNEPRFFHALVIGAFPVARAYVGVGTAECAV
jgi:hypothetical protein